LRRAVGRHLERGEFSCVKVHRCVEICCNATRGRRSAMCSVTVTIVVSC